MTKLTAVVPGDKRGRLTLMYRLVGPGEEFGVFACECGAMKPVRMKHWQTGHSRSCGCLAHGNHRTHGLTDTPIYKVYGAMRLRTNGNFVRRPNYADVRHDPRWDTFEGFLANPPAGEYEVGKVLARYGDTGDYTPENCRWATKSENSREANETRGGYMNVLPDGRYAVDVAREHGISIKRYVSRVRRGWSLLDACTLPLGTRLKPGRWGK